MAPLFSRALTLAGLLSAVLAAPAPNRLQPRQSDSAEATQDGVAVPTQTPYGPSGSSGSLRGSPDLLGYSSDNSISSPDLDVPASDFTLGPGQVSPSDVSVPIDLSNVQNPQPIRGPPNDMPTDSGPSTLL